MNNIIKQFLQYVKSHYVCEQGWELYDYVAEKILTKEDFIPDTIQTSEEIWEDTVGELITTLSDYDEDLQIGLSYEGISIYSSRNETQAELYNRLHNKVLHFISIVKGKQQAQAGFLGECSTLKEIVDFMLKNNIKD